MPRLKKGRCEPSYLQHGAQRDDGGRRTMLAVPSLPLQRNTTLHAILTILADWENI